MESSVPTSAGCVEWTPDGSGNQQQQQQQQQQQMLIIYHRHSEHTSSVTKGITFCCRNGRGERDIWIPETGTNWHRRRRSHGVKKREMGEGWREGEVRSPPITSSIVVNDGGKGRERTIIGSIQTKSVEVKF